MNDFSELKGFLQQYQARVEHTLQQWLPPADQQPGTLHEAMRYSALNGGKRIRPILAYATAQALNIPMARVDGPACALELIHCYSLIHDDLPCMDDDDLRRGRPTCHKVFGEAMAVLAGDAMQALAFHILTKDPSMVDAPAQRLRMIDHLAVASGSRGMAGGQAIDLMAVGQQLQLAELEMMHIHKTGALIRASVNLALLSDEGVSDATFQSLDAYAKCIGLAFQIRDDILDVEGDTETLGKAQGADLALDKPTYPALLGMAGAKARAQELHQEALDHLSQLGN
ncbi:MAG: (2E,6E)-farnesyl diphosphate synthase, partial [Anaerolineae bacterium]|nr:(2E,6E)-farnesyl diphosphate synthase [Anaerolineae bacterium]